MMCFCEDDDCYLKIVPSKYPVIREREMKNLLSRVITLNSKGNSCMWCKGYGDKLIPRIHNLLCHLTQRSSIINLHLEVMCHPTSGPYSRINIKLPKK